MRINQADTYIADSIYKSTFWSAVSILLLLTLIFLPAPSAYSQSNPEDKNFTIPRIDEEPQLDGRLDDSVWQQAALITDFHQVDPVEFNEPTQRTEVRVFYTEDALYVSAKMYDDPELVNARILRQGQGLQADDIFVVILDPYLDRRNGYQFEVNPNGLRVEGLFQNITDVQRNWIGIWETESRIDEDGWTTELKIPFQTISFNPDSDTWGINFQRKIRRLNETIAWVSRNRQVNPSVAGTMQGLAGLRQGIGLDVVPSMVLRQERTFGPAGMTDESFEPQLDMFYKITPQMNAALTINTDFSATEVDDRQVNLTRFSLFFPEKRDFFIRDADIFEFGQIGTSGFSGGSGNPAVPNAAAQNGRPFFSRRIGLSTTGAPVDINVGAKLSGRVGNWNVGTLLVSQGEDDLTGVDSQTVFVGRAVLNVLSESQLGVIVTDGDSQSNLDNTVAGVDFRYRNSRLPGNRLLQGVMWYQQSDSEGITGDDAAWGIGLSSPNAQGWRGGVDYKRIEENFDPALGFVSQAGVQDTALDGGYRHFFRAGSYLRSLYGGFDGYRSELIDGGLVSQSKGLRLTGNNNTGDGMFVRAMENREVLYSPFTVYRSSDGLRTVTLPAGDYTFNEYLIGLDTGDQRMFSGRLTYRWGEYYDGERTQRGVDLNIRPEKHLQLSIGYNENEIDLPYGEFTVRLFTFNTNIAFNSRLSWNNLIQYDNVSEVMGFNSRLHYIPKAGQQAFLVFNYGLSDPDKDNSFQSTNSDISLKFNYTFRF